MKHIVVPFDFHLLVHNKMKFYLTLVALSTFSWDEQTVVGVNALDIGSTLKRMNGANAQDINDNAKTDGSSKAVEQQRIVDASTGTITSNDYDYAASTTKRVGNSNPNCNELMAQAVVLASEEKEVALSDRDTAQAEALACRTELANREEGIKEGREETLKLKVELEAVRLMTDRLLEEANDEHREEKEALIKDQHDAISEWETRLEELEEAHSNAKIDLEEAHGQEVAKLQMKAEMDIANIQEDLGDLQANLHSAELTHGQEVSALNKSHNQTVAELEAAHLVQMSLLEQEKAKVENAHDEELRSIRSNFEKTLEAMKTQHERSMSESIHAHATQITKLQEDTQAEMDDVMTKVTAKMNEIELEMAHVKKTAAEDFTSAEKRAQEEHAALKSEFQAAREKLATEVQTLELAIQDSESVLSDTMEELKYWKSVGMVATSTHFNVTLIKSDLSAYVHHANMEMRELISTHFNILYSKVEDTGKKSIDVLWVRIKPLYVTHLSDVVDITLIPAYKKHVMPMQIKYVRPAKVQVIQVTVELREQLVEILTEKRLQGIDITESFLNLLTKQGFVNTKVPVWVKSALEDMAANASGVFDVLTHVFGIYLVWKLRRRIFSCLVFIMLLPIRFVWFFCPLRLLFGKTKNHKVVDSHDKESSNGHLNDHYPLKAENGQ